LRRGTTAGEQAEAIRLRANFMLLEWLGTPL